MTLPARPMQLTPAYHARLSPDFQAWYEKVFTSDRRVYGHWSVSGYCSPDHAYHREILLVNGKTSVSNPSGVALTSDLDGHTDGRNTNSVALCVGSLDSTATTTSLGDEPPTPAEIQAFVAETVQVCLQLHVGHWNLMSHSEAANNLDFPATDAQGIPAPPSYGPGSEDFERWDWHLAIDTKSLTLIDHLFDGGTARYPADRLPKGPGRFELWTPIPGVEYFPDWWRGQVVLGIQQATKGKW